MILIVEMNPSANLLTFGSSEELTRCGEDCVVFGYVEGARVRGDVVDGVKSLNIVQRL